MDKQQEQIGWRGTVNAWECDEMQRLELRFYVAIAWQSALERALAMGLAENPDTLILQEQHIRFHRELRPNVPAHVHCRLLRREAFGSNMLQTLTASETNETLATFRTSMSHAALFQPTQHVSVHDLPTEALYRGLDEAAPLPDAPDLTGFILSGRGMVPAQDCDGDVMRRELVLGRIAEATPHLVGPFNRAARDATGLSLGGATVECRLRYLRWPRRGDRYEVRSAITAVERRTQRLAHYLINPADGSVFASVEVVALMLDLDRRKAAVIPDELLDLMREHVRPVRPRT